jgi:hypothetical protein
MNYDIEDVHCDEIDGLENKINEIIEMIEYDEETLSLEDL